MTKQKRTVLSIKDRIVTMKLKDIKPYGNNPRKNDDAVQPVANSIGEYDYNQPIVVDKDNVIIVGHTRYKALRKMGVEECDVIVASQLSEEKAREYRIADNSTGAVSVWDFDKLVVELDGIDIDMGEFGLDLGTVSAYEDSNLEITEDEAPEVNFDEEPTSKYGEVYQLGDHRLMCGDSTKEADIVVLLNGNLADMVFTDPPWNVNYGEKEHPNYKQRTILNDSMDTEDFKEFMGALIVKSDSDFSALASKF